MHRDVVILSAARTPIGRYGGALRDVHPAELGAVASRAALARAGVAPDEIGEVVMGQARQAGSGPNPARQVVRRAGLPDATPAQTVNKACASGLQAIVSGAHAIIAGDTDVALVGGMESMSRMPFMLDAADARWGHPHGSISLVDGMYRDGFLCPLSNMMMGDTAELLADRAGITREQADCFAFESQRKAAEAIAAGRFVAEIAAVPLDAEGGGRLVEHDEHPRPETTIESLRTLPPVFRAPDGGPGVTTAGSASGITDGGAALVLASADYAAAQGLRPRARILGWASAGIDPRTMGLGPVPAIDKLRALTGRGIDDFDLVEINEAFAAQVLAVLRELPVGSDRLNVNGGAIALGHPIGCTGARLVVTLLHELERRRARLGLAALCVSGGMGMALAVENLGGG
jgi:acetyl-CoA C-acetyltransferase